MKARVKILSTLVVLILLIPLNAFSWSGKCVGVSDGDTISVMHEGKAEKIRLYGIDCPEKGQPFGKRAKQFTSDMVFGKTVEVKPVTIDRYGRTVAWIYSDDICLNKELLRAGLAWHYKQYSSDEDLALFELDARGKKIGLWADFNPIPPWEWRRGVGRI
jgi:endonuclease YncB( thermonuclease family)